MAGCIAPRTASILYGSPADGKILNLSAALELTGCTLDDVCKTTVWLQDARDFGSVNRVYMSYFGDKKPARSTAEARLMVEARVEIDVAAYKSRA